MNKVVAFIPVRLTSSRLPEKHLRMIGDRSLLSWVIKRLKDSAVIDTIVVCSPDEAGSKPLRHFCVEEGVELFLFNGDENDVVGRLTSASCFFDADICVLASGDCPLHSASTINLLVSSLLDNVSVDIANVGALRGRPPIHEGLLVMRRAVWEKANIYSDTPPLREHLFPVLYCKPDFFREFNVIEVQDDDVFYIEKHRISIDTPSDLTFHLGLFDELSRCGQVYELEFVMRLLSHEPKLKRINSHVKQKKLTDRTKRILFFVTSVANYGYGNLLRALEVAKNCLDIYGMGVHFVVSDSTGLDYVRRSHYDGSIFSDWQALTENVKDKDAIIFDVNSLFQVNDDFLSLVASRMSILSIDNVQPWSRYADKIIIPTAHYTGETYENLEHGASYVVIRSAIQNLKRLNRKKEDVIVVYSSGDEYDELINEEISQLLFRSNQLRVIEYRSFSPDFIEQLSKSKYLISPMGMSAYEGHYLGVKVIVVGRNERELTDISAFNRFFNESLATFDGAGAVRIAETIDNLANVIKTGNEYANFA